MKRLKVKDIIEDRRFGHMVRVIRMQAKVTRKELADLMEITSSYLYDLERGYRHWSPRLKQQFKKAVNL